jgi:hypothetical protein
LIHREIWEVHLFDSQGDRGGQGGSSLLIHREIGEVREVHLFNSQGDLGDQEGSSRNFAVIKLPDLPVLPVTCSIRLPDLQISL